jgi:predicted acylesterase/phospholipase RssA
LDAIQQEVLLIHKAPGQCTPLRHPGAAIVAEKVAHMQRIGLAFSGGGFRATLFHLGMVRFLREANILPAVTHITSVSGGSILAAHLVLNWSRYTDSLKEFDAAAAELIRFVQLDVRNRVVRRYPLAMPVRALRRLMFLGPNRQLTRTGLLEYHYQKYLYGDTCLFQLPSMPRLSILATNLSEGCLCAFTRDGLLMQRRRPGQRFRFDLVHAGLATVPMAVTASSAFPGFFPPLELQGQDVGADPGRFGRLAFTDGGVYDNLGVRMFRCLERSWMARDVRLQREDLADADEVGRALHAASEASEDTPLRRLAQMMALQHNGTAQGRNGTAPAVESADEPGDELLAGLWDVLNHENLAREPVFARLSPPDPDVQRLLDAARDNEIEAGEQLWLNRQLVDAAFRQATGKLCFRSRNVCFDAVLVSDAGKQFKISNSRAGGLITTAMRATDIVMDRVWQLETDTFTGTPGFVFAPISRVIEPEEDPTAPHPEVQRMAADIRTDLDRFSPLEISTLLRHGYCVGRSTCRSRPDLFGAMLPDSMPWDPLASAKDKPARVASAAPQAAAPVPVPETEQSRMLQRSGQRRLWSTLLDYRDWTSFIYVPLLVPILILLPYYAAKWYHQAQVAQRLIEGMAQSNQDYAVISKLLQEGPVAPFEGMPAQEERELAPTDYSGFEVITDMRVLDYRPWKIGSPRAEERGWAYAYRRVRVKKLTPAANEFVMRVRGVTSKGAVRPLNTRIPAVLHIGRDPMVDDGRPLPVFEVAFDLSRLPANEVVDLSCELIVHEPPAEIAQSVSLYVDSKTDLLTCWLLLPEGKHHQSMDFLRYPTTKTGSPERIVPANEMVAPDGNIVALTLLGLEPGYRYERRWTYRD